MFYLYLLKSNLLILKRSIFFHPSQCIREEATPDLAFLSPTVIIAALVFVKTKNTSFTRHLKNCFYFASVYFNSLPSSPHFWSLQKILPNSSLYLPLGILTVGLVLRTEGNQKFLKLLFWHILPFLALPF